MTQIATDLGITRESARSERFEPTGLISQTNVQKAIEQLATSSILPIVPTSVNFAASPYSPLATDTVLFVDTTGGIVQISMPLASSRGNVPLIIKDVKGNAATNKIAIVRTAPDTIDGLTELDVVANYGGFWLLPTSTGWAVSP